MPYSIVTKDGITINNIPDDVPEDSEVLRSRVAAIRAQQLPGAGDHALGGDLLDERKRIFDELNADLNTFEQFAVGTGRGLTTIGRGVGLVEPEDPATRQAFGQLADESIAAQAGEILGEAAPFLAAAPLAGAGLATSAGRVLIPQAQRIGTKILGSSVLGALEGATIVGGKGGTAEEAITGAGVGGVLAGTIEASFPVLSRLGRKVFERLGRSPRGPLLDATGQPTPELQQALDETGTSFAELTETAFAQVDKPGVDAAQATRAARFNAQDIPATAGDITQQLPQQAAEQRLMSQASSEAGGELRQFKLGQSEAFVSRVDELVDSLGVPAETGDSLKSALSGREKLLREEKNALYKQVADTSPEVANLPLITDDILAAMPEKRDLRRLSRLAGSQVDAVQDLLVEFGIDKSDEALEAFAETGGEVVPLNLGNFEEFRQALNQIDRADTTGAAKVVTGPIRKALDIEADMIDQHVKASGLADDAVLDTLKAARGRVKTLKTEFDPQSIAGRLIDVKRGGEDVIKSSKMANELLKPAAPIENLQSTLASLRKSGPDGARAIKNLQATTVLNALEASLGAASRKTGGIQTVGGNQFSKSLEKFGGDKLKELFKGNEKALNRLLNLKQTALDISPEGAAVPKGSAPVILDIVKRAGSLPGLAAIRDTVSFIVNAGKDERAVRKALNAKPVFKRVAGALEQDFPAVASALGIAAVVPKTREEGR